MEIQRHVQAPPWTVQRGRNDATYVIDSDGNNILAITSTESVPIPRFKPSCTEAVYIQSLSETALEQVKSLPDVLHLFEHDGLSGLCALVFQKESQ